MPMLEKKRVSQRVVQRIRNVAVFLLLSVLCFFGLPHSSLDHASFQKIRWYCPFTLRVTHLAFAATTTSHAEERLRLVEERVLELLTPVYGANHVVVKASLIDSDNSPRPSITVAVIIDTSRSMDVPKSVELIRSEQERICDLISHAAGLSTKRGDSILVSFLPFRGENDYTLWFIGAGGVLLSLFLFGLGRVLFGKKRSQQERRSLGRVEEGEDCQSFDKTAVKKMTERTAVQTTVSTHQVRRLGNRLTCERPQSIAIALSLLPTDTAALTLGYLSLDMQAATIACLATRTDVDMDVQTLIWKDLLADIVGHSIQPCPNTSDGISLAQDLVHLLPTPGRQALERRLAKLYPEVWQVLTRGKGE